MTLQAHQLTCMRGERELFRKLSFELAPGAALRIAGGNGSGKTSLLRILCGLAAPQEGKVLWKGGDINAGRDEFFSELVYVGHASGIKDDLTAAENLAVTCTLSGRRTTVDEAGLALSRHGLGSIAELPARLLSQGQRKRVALARLALASANTLWLLDEPFTALDQEAISALTASLNAHLADGGMLVYTTHQDIVLNAQRATTLDLDLAVPC